MNALQESRDAAPWRAGSTTPSNIGGAQAEASHVLLHPDDVIAKCSLHCNDTIPSPRYIVKSILLRDVATAQSAVTIVGVVGKRRVFSKDLGEYFVSLRAEKGWKQSQAADIASRREIRRLSYQTLRGLEEGKTKNPDPSTLRAIAKLYEKSYEEVVARVVANRYGINLGDTVKGRDLIRPAAAGDSEASAGGPDVSLAPRVLAEREQALRRILQNAKSQIAELALRLEEEIDATASPAAKGRRRARKTG